MQEAVKSERDRTRADVKAGTGDSAIFLVSMAKAPVLGLLVWALSVELTGTCLRCWPDAAKYFGYDAKLLLAGETQTVTRLKQLFLSSSEDRGIYGGAFLGIELREELF